MICETISRAFSLSSAGTIYQGASRVLVALRHCLKSRHIAFPELSLLNVGKAEFPILIRLIDPLKKALSLLVFRQVEIEFDDPRAIAVQMFFQTHNGAKSALPDGLLVERFTYNSLAAEDLGVHADDQHLLVIGSVKDADPPAFRQVSGGSPQKIVLQFRRAGVSDS